MFMRIVLLGLLLSFKRNKNSTDYRQPWGNDDLVTGHSLPALPVYELIQPALAACCSENKVQKRIQQTAIGAQKATQSRKNIAFIVHCLSSSRSTRRVYSSTNSSNHATSVTDMHTVHAFQRTGTHVLVAAQLRFGALQSRLGLIQRLASLSPTICTQSQKQSRPSHRLHLHSYAIESRNVCRSVQLGTHLQTLGNSRWKIAQKKETTSLFVMLSLRFSARLRCMAYVHSAVSALGARLTWPVRDKQRKA
jgi:hypothetical protein